VVAKGEGELARRIREVAAESGVPIRRDDDLVELLAQIDIDREIPAELYAAVAEILSWIYRANDDMRKETVQ
jgi:flagellar biosynthesis protein